jgi:hypothetical protein
MVDLRLVSAVFSAVSLEQCLSRNSDRLENVKLDNRGLNVGRVRKMWDLKLGRKKELLEIVIFGRNKWFFNYLFWNIVSLKLDRIWLVISDGISCNCDSNKLKLV